MELALDPAVQAGAGVCVLDGERKKSDAQQGFPLDMPARFAF